MYTLKIDSEYTHSVSQAQTRKFHSRSLALIRLRLAQQGCPILHSLWSASILPLFTTTTQGWRFYLEVLEKNTNKRSHTHLPVAINITLLREKLPFHENLPYPPINLIYAKHVKFSRVCVMFVIVTTHHHHPPRLSHQCER